VKKVRITSVARILTAVNKLRRNDGFVFGFRTKNNPVKIAKIKIAVMLLPIQW